MKDAVRNVKVHRVFGVSPRERPLHHPKPEDSRPTLVCDMCAI